MSCYQNLALNNNTGDLAITSGNDVNLVQAIQNFGIKTPVVDFSISGNVISLFYKDATGLMQVKQVTLPPAAMGATAPISVASTSSILSSIALGVITSSVKVSATNGNSLVINADGLYVPTPVTVIQVEASPSITVTYQAGIIGAVANISAQSGNTLTVVSDGLYVPPNTLTTSQIRNVISATAPVAYDLTTGIISMAQSNSSTNGWLSATDWNTFNNKLSGATSVSSLTTVPTLAGVSAGIVQTRGIAAGAGIAVNLLTQDIIVSTTATVPTVNAGPNLQVATPATTAVMNGNAAVTNGFIASTTWLLLDGPNVPVITSAGSLSTTITGLIVGTYTYRLMAVASTGLVATDDMSINVYNGSIPVDTIYIGVQSSPTPPNAVAVAAGTASSQNGGADVTADWTGLTSGGAQYCWFAIPNNGGTYFKTKWYVDSFNNGAIGGPTNLFGNYTQVTVDAIVYNVSISNYETQFSASCLLQA